MERVYTQNANSSYLWVVKLEGSFFFSVIFFPVYKFFAMIINYSVIRK